VTTERAGTRAGGRTSGAGRIATAARPRRARRAPGQVLQLPLVGDGTAVRRYALDERTRRVGRAGVAEAREILRRAREERDQVAS
jgi:hypothetical protein